MTARGVERMLCGAGAPAQPTSSAQSYGKSYGTGYVDGVATRPTHACTHTGAPHASSALLQVRHAWQYRPSCGSTAITQVSYSLDASPQPTERPHASVHVTRNVPTDAVNPSCTRAQRRSVLAPFAAAELLNTPAPRIMCSEPNTTKAGAPWVDVTPQASPHTSAMSCLIQ